MLNKNQKRMKAFKQFSYSLLAFICLLPIFLWINKSNFVSLFVSLFFYITFSLILTTRFGEIFSKHILVQINVLDKKWLLLWIGLSSFMGIWLTINIPLPYPPLVFNNFLDSSSVKILLFLSYSCLVGFSFFISTITISKKNFQEKKEKLSNVSIKNWVKFSIPMILIWSIYLLAFFPGMMSADSFSQWNQMLTGVYVNHHPVIHTLFIWLFTRIYLSPFVVSLAQILFMAIIASLFFSLYEEIGVQKKLIWIGLAFFTLIPANGTMVNTIWKDIPHGIAVMGIVYVFLRIIYSFGEWLNNRVKILIFGFLLSIVSLMRHDGIVIGIGALILILAFYPKIWKSWFISFIFFMFFYFGIRGPLYSSINVQESKALEDSSLSLYEMAAYSLPESQPDQIIKNMEIWPPNWNCSIWSKLSPDWKKNSLDKSQAKIDVLKNFIKRIPKILIYNYRCERSLEFIVYDPYGEVRNASHVEVLVDPNPFGIVHDSKLPQFRDLIADFVIETSYNPDLNWLFWRPALFLYLTLFTSSIIILRNRNFRFILIVVPALLQAITLTMIFAAPNFRYYYATYLVALITLPLIFSPKINPETKNLIENEKTRLRND
ncbi:MAG: hypothetical protein CVU41_01020 [Chloroflexi bacterium HGW-Chloroflexi-3]|nr:MAG: hypothetical protein CVU41_01020 [Chloroflexi bacterium HGW-Chloroflexi-3]